MSNNDDRVLETPIAWDILPAELRTEYATFEASILPAESTTSSPVRVKGGMSLQNGMWHGVRNHMIMRNIKYGKWRKEMN